MATTTPTTARRAVLLLTMCLAVAQPAAPPPLGAFPCDASDALQRLVVRAADGTVRSADGTLCVTYVAPSPAELVMAPCVAAQPQQAWRFVATRSSFEGADGDGNCIAWNSQGAPGSPTRSLSTWTCADIEWNGWFSPTAASESIVANCSAPGACVGALCVGAQRTCVPGAPCLSATYAVTDALGPARAFDGVGGLSGGGGVSRLLPSYDAATRAQVRVQAGPAP